MSDAILVAEFLVPKLTERLSWQPCHDWNGGRGLPGSAEALLMTYNQCGQTVASPSRFGDAKPCVMRLAPNSWLGVNPARFAVEFLQNELEQRSTDTIPAMLIEAERRGMMRAAEIASRIAIADRDYGNKFSDEKQDYQLLSDRGFGIANAIIAETNIIRTAASELGAK